LDFGVVSQQGRESIAAITITGMVPGTPAFLAPELVSGVDVFDGRADIYALGCVAFWLLTGRPPFEAPDAVSLLRLHSTTVPCPPSTFAASIPGEMDALVLDCLSKDPARRPQSAETVWDRLEAVPISSRWDQHAAREWWRTHEPSLTATD
jgi:serine/threonine-protein kinase